MQPRRSSRRSVGRPNYAEQLGAGDDFQIPEQSEVPPVAPSRSRKSKGEQKGEQRQEEAEYAQEAKDDEEEAEEEAEEEEAFE